MNLEADHRVDDTYINEFLRGPRLAWGEKNLKSRIFNIPSRKAYTFNKVARMVEENIRVRQLPWALAY